MANELNITGALTYQKGLQNPLQMARAGVLITVAGTDGVQLGQAINTTDTILPLGPLASAADCYAIFYNADPTNWIKVKHAAAGQIILKINPGEISGPLRLGDNVTAPVAISQASTPLLEYVLVPP